MYKLNQYKIEHRISTLIGCATFENGGKPASFYFNDIEFSHYEFSYVNGWKKDEWVAKSTLEDENWLKAINNFRKQLLSIIPKISFISQAYIEFRLQPYLVHKNEHQFALIKYISDTNSVGLMFGDNEKRALSELMSKSIPEEFFLYWNDAVNTTGYSAKLLLMFSAIEALTKKPNGKTNYMFRKEILGELLKKEIFGEKGNSDNALRNRLVHGEYFNEKDSKNYLEIIHKKIINYFNTKILSEPLINENVKNPQRHPWGNYKSWKGFIERSDNGNHFELDDILANFENNGVEKPIIYCLVPKDRLVEKY